MVIPSGTAERIKVLFQNKLSPYYIQRQLKKEDINVSVRSIYNIVNNKGLARKAIANGKEKPKKNRPCFAEKKFTNLIKNYKAKKLFTQTEIAKKNLFLKVPCIVPFIVN